MALLASRYWHSQENSTMHDVTGAAGLCASPACRHRRILDSIMSFVSDCNFLKSIKTMRNFVALVGWRAHKVCQATTTNNDKDEGDSARAMAHRKIGYDTSLIMNYKLAFIFKERVITRVFFYFVFAFALAWMLSEWARKYSVNCHQRYSVTRRA